MLALNHLTRDCLQNDGRNHSRRIKLVVHCHQYCKVGHLSKDYSRENRSWQSIIATLATFHSVNSELPMVRLDVCRKWCIAFVDSGCSCTIMSQKVCRSWQKLNISVITIDSGMQMDGFGLIILHLKSGWAVMIETLENPPWIWAPTLDRCNQSPWWGVYFKVGEGTLSFLASFGLCSSTSTLCWRTWFSCRFWSATKCMDSIVEIGRRQGT